MKLNKLCTFGIAISALVFTGCSVTPHVNISDKGISTVDISKVDFSKEMKQSTICENPHQLDGELTVMKAAKKGGISTVKYVTKEDHFTTQRKFFSTETRYSKKCITVYGE